MIRTRPSSGSRLNITASDLYHYRGSAIQSVYSSSSPLDSVLLANNWWGDTRGADTGFQFQDSLGRASTDRNAAVVFPFSTLPLFPVGTAVGVVTTRDSLLNPVNLGDSIGIYARVIDANGRGVGGQSVTWTPIPGGASSLAPVTSSSDAGGRVNAGWQFTNTAGRLTAHATGGGGFTDYFIDVLPGASTAVNWVLDAARSQGVVTDSNAITFTSTNRTGVVVTHAQDAFGNATQPFNICVTDVNVPGCTFPFPPYGFVDSTHTSGGVDGDTIFFHANVSQPGTFVLRATYSTALGQAVDSVLITMAAIPVGVKIDRDEFTAGVQATPDTALFNALCPGGQPNIYCQREFHAFVVDSGFTPVANQDAVFTWTLVPAAGAPVSVTTRGTPANDSALVTALANGFVRLVVEDTTPNNFGTDTLPILVAQTVSTILVSPDTVSVLVGGTATFTAAAIDAAGDTIPATPIHWRPDNPVNPHMTLVDTATANQATVRLDSTPMGGEYVTAFAVRAPGDTAFGFGQVMNPVLQQFPVGLEPWAIAANSQTHAVYVGHQFGPLYKVDGTSDAVVDSATPGLTIGAVAVNSVTNRVYAATNQGVVVLDGGTLDTIRTVLTGSNSPGVTNLQGLTVDSVNNRIFVTVAPPGAAPMRLLRQIDGATNTFSGANDVALPDTGAGAVFNPADGLVYVAIPDSNLVAVVDPSSHSIVNRIPVGVTPTFVAVNPVTNRVYAVNQASNDLSVIDAASQTVVTTVPLFYNVGSVAVDVTHDRVYVGVINLPYLIVVNGATNGFENILLTGNPSFSEAVRGVVVDGVAGNGKIFTAGYSSGTVSRLAF
jgi:YVTN family beta-propeller protein